MGCVSAYSEIAADFLCEMLYFKFEEDSLSKSGLPGKVLGRPQRNIRAIMSETEEVDADCLHFR